MQGPGIGNAIAAAAFCLVSAAPLEAVEVRSCDRTVLFDRSPQAAVSNDSNLTEMMLALDLADRMVGFTGISKWKTLDPDHSISRSGLPELSPGYPTREILLSVGADFLFAGWNYGMRVGGEVTPETLEPLGIKVYELTESCIHVGEKLKVSMEDMYQDILNLGKIFGVGDRASGLVAQYRAEVDQLASKVLPGTEPIRVFVYDSGEDAPFTAGRYAMPTALIEAAGGRNVMDDLEKSWATIGWEAVVERNPEAIVIVNYGNVTAAEKRRFLLSNPAFAGVDAVKNDRFVVLEYVEATPGPRNIAAIRKLVEGFHKAGLSR